MIGRRTRTEGVAEQGRRDEGRAEQGRAGQDRSSVPPFGLRLVNDAGGAGWRIYEMAASHIPGARGARCLVMENASQGVCRRFWRYPADWQDLSADELLALSPRG